MKYVLSWTFWENRRTIIKTVNTSLKMLQNLVIIMYLLKLTKHKIPDMANKVLIKKKEPNHNQFSPVIIELVSFVKILI